MRRAAREPSSARSEPTAECERRRKRSRALFFFGSIQVVPCLLGLALSPAALGPLWAFGPLLEEGVAPRQPLGVGNALSCVGFSAEAKGGPAGPPLGW